MASGERDLTLRLVTKQEDFETKKAADELDKLARESDTTGDKLKKLETDAKSAGGSLDTLAGDARTAGTSISGSMSDAGDAGSGAFGDMRDEAGAALMETAGSFDGTMQGAIDGIQGALPAIGASFGALGMIVGSAASVALGFWKAGTAELKAQVSALTAGMIADGGKLGRDSVLAKLEEFASDGSIQKLADQARAAKVPINDYLLAMAGDPEALDRTRAAVDRYADATDEAAVIAGQMALAEAGLVSVGADQRDAVEDVTTALDGQAEAQALATEAVTTYTDASTNAAAASELQRLAAEETAGVQEDYAAAMDTAADSAVAMGEAVTAGVDAVLAAQDKQMAAAADFEANTTDVYTRLGEDAVQWALAQGEQAEEAMQLLADAPQAKGEKITANYRTLGAQSAGGLIEGLASKATAARDTGAEVAAKIAAGIRESNAISRAGAAAHGALKTELTKPITLNIKIPSGKSMSQELTERLRP